MAGLFCLTGPGVFINIHSVARKEQGPDETDWAFGDGWKQGSPDDDVADAAVYVEIFRADTGRGFDDSSMLDLVGYLGSFGIRATYDSFSLGLEPAAIKTYVLKVEEGKEAEALELLERKNSSEQ